MKKREISYMSNIMIRPWPFNKNEEAELYWLCSPYLSYNKSWIITAVFKKDKQIKMVELPWGTLPLLRLGQKYINGVPIDKSSKGFIGELFIKDEKFEICTSFDMPPKLYYLYKIYKCGIEKLCKIRIASKEYYIPCMEIIRSFFVKSKTLANYILKPNGLDFIIDKTEVIEDAINIYLSSEVPKKLANDDEVTHLAWIKYNSIANETWNSVYNNIFKKAVEVATLNPVKALTDGMTIELIPPINKECKWNYRGIYSGNSVLILEITATGFDIPYSTIYYYHPSFDKVKTNNRNSTIRRLKKGNDEIFELPGDYTDGSTKKKNEQPIIDISSTNFVHKGVLNINRLKGIEKKSRNGVQVINVKENKNLNGYNSNIIASTQDWNSTGKIEPVEFKSLELIHGEYGRGLENFYDLMEYVIKVERDLEILITEIMLPNGKSFSVYPNGERRVCAIVKLLYKGLYNSYILEVGRSDEWSISTLLITISSVSSETHENIISNILISLIDNNGHWNKNFLNAICNIKFETLKHIKYQTPTTFLYKIIEKLRNLMKFEE